MTLSELVLREQEQAHLAIQDALQVTLVLAGERSRDEVRLEDLRGEGRKDSNRRLAEALGRWLEQS